MKSPEFEQKETVSTEVKIISPDALLEIIYKGKSLPQDERFLSTEKGGVFKYFNPTEVDNMNRFSTKKSYPVIERENKIVGLAELEQDPRDEKNYWIKFVSVDPQYQNNGYASKLLTKIFEFAKENDYSLEPSFYSQQGLEKLKNVIDRLAKETGVKIIERNK